MLSLKNKKNDERYGQIMSKLLERGDYESYEKVKNEYLRMLSINVQMPCSMVTRQMSEEHRQKSNKLLQKMCICTDIAEKCLYDLESLMQKYDEYLTLPLRAEMKMMKKLAKNVQKIVYDGSSNPKYAEAFGDLADAIDEQVDEILNKKMDE